MGLRLAAPTTRARRSHLCCFHFASPSLRGCIGGAPLIWGGEPARGAGRTVWDHPFHRCSTQAGPSRARLKRDATSRGVLLVGLDVPRCLPCSQCAGWSLGATLWSGAPETHHHTWVASFVRGMLVITLRKKFGKHCRKCSSPVIANLALADSKGREGVRLFAPQRAQRASDLV